MSVLTMGNLTAECSKFCQCLLPDGKVPTSWEVMKPVMWNVLKVYWKCVVQRNGSM